MTEASKEKIREEMVGLILCTHATAAQGILKEAVAALRQHMTKGQVRQLVSV